MGALVDGWPETGMSDRLTVRLSAESTVLNTAVPPTAANRYG